MKDVKALLRQEVLLAMVEGKGHLDMTVFSVEHDIDNKTVIKAINELIEEGFLAK